MTPDLALFIQRHLTRDLLNFSISSSLLIYILDLDIPTVQWDVTYIFESCVQALNSTLKIWKCFSTVFHCWGAFRGRRSCLVMFGTLPSHLVVYSMLGVKFSWIFCICFFSREELHSRIQNSEINALLFSFFGQQKQQPSHVCFYRVVPMVANCFPLWICSIY